MVWQLLVCPVVFHLKLSVQNHTGRVFLLPPSLHFKCNSLLYQNVTVLEFVTTGLGRNWKRKLICTSTSGLCVAALP